MRKRIQKNPRVAFDRLGGMVCSKAKKLARSWDTEPKGFAVAPRANIEALTMACWPGGYELFVGDTEGTVHMSEDGCVTKGNHAAALRGEISLRAAAAATH